MRAMKVLFFCNLMPNKVGAFEQLLVRMGKMFREGGDSLVLAFASEPISDVARALTASGTRWHIVQGWDGPDRGVRPWAFLLEALRLLRAERPDIAVVHFGNELPTLAAIGASRLLGLGSVRWVWQQDQRISDPGPRSSRLSRIGLLRPFVHHFVAVYDGGRRSLTLRGVPESRISVIHNAVAEPRAKQPRGWLRTALDIPSSTVVLTSVASLLARKRTGFLLECVSRLASRDVDACLVLVGEGPDRALLERRARDLELGDRVHFLGLRNDVSEILSDSDVFVHAALSEACSYAILESMAAGIPAVVCEAGAAREQVEDGESGFVVSPGDPETFVERLTLLSGDPTRRGSFGAAARARWHERYRVENTGAKYLCLYRNLAEGGHAKGSVSGA